MFLGVVNGDPKPQGKKRAGYDNGFRMGTFDKCNGREARSLDNVADTKYNRAYRSGYLDGFVTNEVRL